MTRPRGEAHEIVDDCAEMHCVSHQVDEPGDGYIACGECGHNYRTPLALAWAWHVSAWRLWWFELRACHNTWVGRRTLWSWRIRTALLLWRVFIPRWPSQIWYCQECSHDF